MRWASAVALHFPAFVPQGQIEEDRRGNGSKVDPDPDVARDARLTEAPVERGAQVAQMLVSRQRARAGADAGAQQLNEIARVAFCRCTGLATVLELSAGIETSGFEQPITRPLELSARHRNQ